MSFEISPVAADAYSLPKIERPDGSNPAPDLEKLLQFIKIVSLDPLPIIGGLARLLNAWTVPLLSIFNLAVLNIDSSASVLIYE